MLRTRPGVVAILVLVVLVGIGGPAVQAAPPQPEVTAVQVLLTGGGRVDWAPDGRSLAIDRPGDDGFFDVWIVDLGGSGRCLTCDHGRLGLPAGHKGNPAFHPGGEWVVFQVEQPEHPGPQGSFLASPGAGAYNDLWVVRTDGGAAHQLVHHDLATPGRGSLHPHFDPTGAWLTWAQLVRGQGQPFDALADPSTVANDRTVNSTSGEWEIALADVTFTGDVPHLGEVRTFQPGGPAFYETHELRDGGTHVLYSANPDRGQHVGSMDVFELDTATGAVTRRVTDTPASWEEHAHYARGARRILHAAGALAPHDDYPYPGPPVAAGAFVAAPQLDLWVHEARSESWRLTFFGDDGWPHHFDGSEGASVVDNALSPDGRTIAALVLVRSVGPFIRQSALQPVVLIHLSRPLG